MKKILITIRNIILGITLFVYLAFTIAISTLLLNRNDYGITQFGDKILILVDNKVANDKYKNGSLVIVKEKSIEKLEIGEEIFVYQTNKKDKTVKVVIAEIGKINLDTTSPYVVLENDGTAWGEEFVAGTAYKTFENIGSLLLFVESKWVFFCTLIVPCFFILLYEIHLVIVTIKFGDYEDEEEEIEKVEENFKAKLESKDEEIEALMKQIEELKKENNQDEDKQNEKKTKKETKTNASTPKEENEVKENKKKDETKKEKKETKE